MPHLLLNQGNNGWDREMGKRGDGDKLAIPGFVRCGYKNSSLEESKTAPYNIRTAELDLELLENLEFGGGGGIARCRGG